MNKKSWKYLLLATLAPVVGWLSETWYSPDEMSALGAVTGISWALFWSACWVMKNYDE